MTENNDKALTIEAELNKNIFNGYSDYELELLVDPPEINRGIAPWVYWTSELYSFGRLYREWSYYPKILPLFIYSDHGVCKKSSFAPHELNNDSNVHFTFNKERELKNSNIPNRIVKCVPHPWVTYRRKNNITQLNNSKGTLIFFVHSTIKTGYTGHDTDEYFDEIKQLPDKYHPLVLCMHMHDIRKGYHKKLRKHGIPIVTAGNTASVNFVDEFYNLIRQFNYACSNTTGSHVPYCIEMGIPYFLIGKAPKAWNNSSEKSPLESIGIQESFQREASSFERTILNEKLDYISLEQRLYAEWMLGLNSNVTRLNASWILWREFFRNWMKWHIMIRPSIAWILRKLGLLNIVKNYLK